MSLRKMKKGSRRLRALIGKAIARKSRLPARYPVHCLRCGYRWKAKVKKPKFCSRCKSTAWMKSKASVPPKRPRLRYWVKASVGDTGQRITKGRPVRRVAGRRGYMSEALYTKRKRDAEMKRQKRAQTRIDAIPAARD